MTKFAFRSIYISPKGFTLVEFDLSQAETWITAYLAKEDKMKHFLHNSDIHTETASFIDNVPFDKVTTISRYKGKKGNHQLSYGSSHYRLAQSINSESDTPPYVTVTVQEAKSISDRWHLLYMRIKEWHGEIQESTKYTRKLVTPHGRERIFYEEWGNELWKEMYANLPQSTVADHLNGMIQDEIGIPGGLLEVKRKFPTIKIVNQSHDSFTSEVPDEIVDDYIPVAYNLIKRPLMINSEVFTIPVDCKKGERWGELSKVDIK